MLLYKIAEKVYELENQGKKVIKMNVGELDFDTPDRIIERGVDSIRDGNTRYCSSAGEAPLREEIARIHDAEPSNVVIMPGSKLGIFCCMDMICRGGKLLTHAPGWPAYWGMADHFEVAFDSIRLSMEDGWKIDMDRLGASLEGKDMFIMNNPGNPTSHVWSHLEAKKIIDISLERNVPILLDIAYQDISFDPMPDLKWEPGMIIVNSFSKSLAMTGWRVGYVVAEPELAKRLTKLNQISITCVPRFIQHAALAGLKRRREITRRFGLKCKKRAETAMSILRKNSIPCSEPGAGFYVFPRLPVPDAYHVTMNLLEKHGIATVPGSVFGNYKSNIRISLCYEPEVIADSMKKLLDVAGCG